MSHVQSLPKASSALASDTLTLTGVGANHSLLIGFRLSGNSDVLTNLVDSISSDGAPVRIVDQANAAASIRTYLYKKEACAAGDHTFTVNWSGNQTWRWFAAEYSESAVDVLATPLQFASGTSIVGPSVSPTIAGGTLVGIISPDSSTSIAPNNGETERQEVNTALQIEDIAAAGLGPYTPTWLLGAARAGVAISLVMKGTASASSRIDHASLRGLARGMFRGF